MDPVTHTLTGAALSRAGLNRLTPLATTTLVLAANAPDVDLVSYAGGAYLPLALRRGVTHGPLGWILLPFAVTGAVLAWDRLVRRRRKPAEPAVRVGPLLILSLLGVLTHPLLDWMNTYGIRLLAPFSPRWFYGDALFIIDPWVWLVLIGGIAAGRWLGGHREAAARIALLVTALYMGGMGVASAAAEAIVREALAVSGTSPPVSVMYAPRPANPFSGRIVAELDDGYLTGAFDWLGEPRLRMAPDRIPRVDRVRPAEPRGPTDEEILQAVRASPDAAAFLTWSRFPAFQVQEIAAGGHVVRISDLRYARRGGAGSLAGLDVRLDGEGRLVEP